MTLNKLLFQFLLFQSFGQLYVHSVCLYRPAESRKGLYSEAACVHRAINLELTESSETYSLISRQKEKRRLRSYPVHKQKMLPHACRTEGPLNSNLKLNLILRGHNNADCSNVKILQCRCKVSKILLFVAMSSKIFIFIC